MWSCVRGVAIASPQSHKPNKHFRCARILAGSVGNALEHLPARMRAHPTLPTAKDRCTKVMRKWRDRHSDKYQQPTIYLSITDSYEKDFACVRSLVRAWKLRACPGADSADSIW